MQSTRKVGGGSAPQPTAVLISGAGTSSSNGNYVWDGFFNEKRLYISAGNELFWNGSQWIIYDSTVEENTYSSPNLIAWGIIGGAEEPAPTGTLSYS